MAPATESASSAKEHFTPATGRVMRLSCRTSHASSRGPYPSSRVTYHSCRTSHSIPAEGLATAAGWIVNRYTQSSEKQLSAEIAQERKGKRWSHYTDTPLLVVLGNNGNCLNNHLRVELSAIPCDDRDTVVAGCSSWSCDDNAMYVCTYGFHFPYDWSNTSLLYQWRTSSAPCDWVINYVNLSPISVLE